MEIIPLKNYNIFVGPIQETLPVYLGMDNYNHIIIIADENTARDCLPAVMPFLDSYQHQTITVSPGEKHKNINSCCAIWSQMMESNASRDALVINLGGGVIGDMGGFSAATFKRGLRFVQMPTTLLSQVDASIGGKLGIDFKQIKNSIGLFKDPEAVFVDVEFLKTLPEQELRSGYAEMIKHSLIADTSHWEKLRQKNVQDWQDWGTLVVDSMLIKKRIVEEDPLEKGIRKALNFGHTIGHAIESFALETATPLLHGEAIAIGMICETFLSQQLLGLREQDVVQVSRYLLQQYGFVPLSPDHFDAYIELMRNDKKNQGTTINFSLIHPLGQAVVNQTCGEELIKASLDFYNKLGEAIVPHTVY
jgi:3-dehydroquinate synthase